MESQDIDALLISALYGELTPADEARLAVHLQAHPNDRAALADLTQARAAIRDSRALEWQAEPPQAVSALLLQEAARRVVKPLAVRDEEPGWFTRFIRSIAAHPAIAAAAMLVVVLGAGALLSRHRGKAMFSEAHDVAVAPMVEQPAAVSAQAPTGADDPGAEGSAGTEVNLPSAAGQPGTATLGGAALEQQRQAPGAAPPAPPMKPSVAAPAPARKSKVSTASGLEVRTKEELAPRDLDESKADRAPTERLKKVRASDDEGEAAVDQAARGRGGARPSMTVQPPPQAPSPAPAQTAYKDVRAENKASDPQTTWAQGQHKNLIAQVRAGDCRAAVSSAMAILDRAPTYYQQNVETDRELKGCLTYIRAERAQRAKRATDKK
ncbi:MAG: anti-sigma factor [Kofleriaceae bacterium]